MKNSKLKFSKYMQNLQNKCVFDALSMSCLPKHNFSLLCLCRLESAFQKQHRFDFLVENKSSLLFSRFGCSFKKRKGLWRSISYKWAASWPAVLLVGCLVGWWMAVSAAPQFACDFSKQIEIRFWESEFVFLRQRLSIICLCGSSLTWGPPTLQRLNFGAPRIWLAATHG